MRAELAPLGIFVTVVEPGWYRTAILSKDVQAQSEKRIDAYENGEIGELRKALAETDGKQVGDTAKACRVIVDVLTMSGCAEGKQIPIRLVLGKDAHDVIREKKEKKLVVFLIFLFQLAYYASSSSKPPHCSLLVFESSNLAFETDLF